MFKYIGFNVGRKSRSKRSKTGRVETAVQKRTEKLGIGIDLLNKALAGDVSALTLLGEMGNEGRRVLYAMPMIKEQSQNFLKGYAAYQQGLVDIFSTGGQAGITVDKANDKLALANKKYGHDNILRSDKAKLDNRLEDQRFENAREIQQLVAYIDYFTAEVEAGFQRDGLEASVAIANLDEQRRHEEEQIAHYLKYGERGNEMYLPTRDYAGLSKTPSATTPIVGAVTGTVKKLWAKLL